MATTTNPLLVPALERVALVCTLLTPLLLLHAHGFAEVSVTVTGLCFLTRAGLTGDWTWLRGTWVRLASVWWAWLVFCSLPIPALGLGDGGSHSLIQGLISVRFPLFVAALEFSVLRDPAARRWMFGIIAAAVIYISVQVVFQFIFRRNFYGYPPNGGVLLTGPFGTPRAAPPLARLLAPVVVPWAAHFLDRGGARQLWAYALLLGSMVVLVIIGARIPVLLAGGSLMVAGLLLPRVRPIVIAAVVAVALVIPALSVVSAPTYDRLVTQTVSLMSDFASTPYGELYTRAFEIARQRPFTGLGFDGFKIGCAQPRYFRPTFDGREADGGGASFCWVHPHNFYFQALVDGGIVSLLLFCALCVSWLVPLARGLWRDPQPLRVGLFATIAAQLVPLQSTSSWWSMPMGGWFYLLLGWALAEARYRDDQR